MRSINKKQMRLVALLTVATILILALFIHRTIRFVDDRVTQSCFDELAGTAKRLAEELRQSVEIDQILLTAMAREMAKAKQADDAVLCEIMGSFCFGASYVSYVELLKENGVVLTSDGAAHNAAGVLDFAREAARGASVSDIQRSLSGHGEKVVRSAVPVTRDGRTIGVLYGVIRLSELAETYKTDIYNGYAQVFLEDGATGDFLLDTWHKSLGNIEDFTGRRLLSGYTWEKAISDMRRGISGRLEVVSETLNKVTYLHYEPVDVNRWNVLVMTTQEVAMRDSMAIRSSLYRMAGVVGAVLLAYMACVTAALFRAYLQVQRLGSEDRTTGLLNRNAYDRYTANRSETKLASITCVYVDVNGLHDINNRCGHAAGDQMLRSVADALKRRFPHDLAYRIGGDEFTLFCEESSKASCEESVRKAAAELEKQGYSIAFGVASRQNETGVDRVTREADERMLENKRSYYISNDRRQR